MSVQTAVDLTGPYELRGKKIEQLKGQVSKLELSYNNLYGEKLNLQDENDQLNKLRVDNDVTIENQKYQLGKYAEELQKLQEEIQALKVFAKRYLEV